MGASSFSPSPMTTVPFIDTVLIMYRIPRTAAPSAPFLSPLPTQRAAANEAVSVTRTSSSARLRSGSVGLLVCDMDTRPFLRKKQGEIQYTG